MRRIYFILKDQWKKHRWVLFLSNYSKIIIEVCNSHSNESVTVRVYTVIILKKEIVIKIRKKKNKVDFDKETQFIAAYFILIVTFH